MEDITTYDKTNSLAHFAQASQLIPGGLMSNFRKEGGYVPTYFTYGKGAHLFDMDGNEYIDYSLSYGPAILGHSNAHLMAAVARQAGTFMSCEVNTLEFEAAKKVIRYVPCAEMVRFACSGTEAVYNAVRVARAFTGKNMVVRFNGHYNGGLDEQMGGVTPDPDYPVAIAGERDDDYFSQMTNTDGRARHALADTFLIEWNDLDRFRLLLEEYGNDIGAVLMEPVMVNVSGCVPKPGYLEGVRELCTQHGVVLIFDEVITGFRMGLGGAQACFGITPDLATFAKALGGGAPVSAFCGKREMMETIASTDVIAGGTYNGNPLSMAAVIATIEELEKDDGAAFRKIETLGNLLGDGLRERFRRYQVDLLIQGFPAVWTLAYKENGREISNHKESLGNGLDRVGLFSSLLNKRGILVQSRFCTSAAHTEEDVTETLNKVEDALIEFEVLCAEGQSAQRITL
jgi:glutamate-1-semialdehyde 2,1-aminomutase